MRRARRPARRALARRADSRRDAADARARARHAKVGATGGPILVIDDLLLAPFERPDPPAQREETGFFTDTTLCIGCKACEVACKQWNQLPADGFRFTGNSYDNTSSLS